MTGRQGPGRELVGGAIWFVALSVMRLTSIFAVGNDHGGVADAPTLDQRVELRGVGGI
jgi:hypothetical protein